MNIGNQIQLLRKQRNMTQEMLAFEIGISTAAVSKWENNNSVPDVVMLCTLADFFQVTTDELLGRNNKNKDIIICDDATFIREVLSSIIFEKGYHNIRLVENGKQLMNAVHKKLPDAIFLDIHLPDINGIELLQNIKTLNNNIKVIIVSADNSETVMNQVIEYAADAFITKPFLPEYVEIVIDKHIS